MVIKDKRANMADGAGLLALRLFWCFITWHKAKVCLPLIKEPHTIALLLHMVIQPCYHPPVSQISWNHSAEKSED